MSNIGDGGQAFPIAVQPDFQFAEPGMSLRDHFAGQALAGIYASKWFTDHASSDLSDDIQVAAAKRAYRAADAMLAVRAKTGGSDA
ncbi:hypothetical protein [Nitratireductor sp. GCM10026969]|uniref:hypothetical protein n=1 Tax=Nitratireductor sp. GCM10026969 TaxID=3252645 RepID=UPI0036135563